MEKVIEKMCHYFCAFEFAHTWSDFMSIVHLNILLLTASSSKSSFSGFPDECIHLLFKSCTFIWLKIHKNHDYMHNFLFKALLMLQFQPQFWSSVANLGKSDCHLMVVAITFSVWWSSGSFQRFQTVSCCVTWSYKPWSCQTKNR